MKRIRILLIALMIALLLPAQVRSDDPAGASPGASSAVSQEGGNSGNDSGGDSEGSSALFGVLILAPAATEAPEQPVQAELILDFSAYDPALDQEDPLVRYDIENEQVTVDFLRVLRQELSGEARVEQSGALSDEDREKLTALAERYQEEQKNEQTEQTASLRLEQNLLILTGDGELTLSDGENSLRLEVKGSDALLTRHMARDDVQVDVVEGFVPAGSGLSYEALDADEAESLAQLYLSFGGLRKDETLPAADTGKKLMNPGPKKTASLRQVSPAGASATGYSAFELSIVRDNQPVGGSGEYAVTLPLPEEAGSLTPRGARQKKITYTLYHVHNGQAEQLDVRAEGDVLCFTTPNFSTFILQYTVDFEYVNPETGELYAYNLPGGEETLLSGLLSALSVDADLSGSEAAFTDPSLIELEPVAGADGVTADWRVRSLMPFDTEEQLTVTLKNGAEVILRVTDEQITTRVMDAKGDTWEITVTYGRDACIPYDAELAVSELLPGEKGYDDYVAASAERVGTDTDNIDLSRVFDIRIVDRNDRGKVYEPADDVEVSICLVGTSLNEYPEVDVLHFVGNEKADGFTVYDMDSTIDGETVRFTTDSFSVYVIVGSTPYLRTYRFFTFDEYGDYTEYKFETDDGTGTFTQTIKNGESIVVPGSPTNPQDPTATFAGWYEDITPLGETEQQLAAEAYDFNHIPEITQTEEVHLYAKFNSYAYVIFHDQYDADSETFPVAYTVRARLENGSAAVDVSDKRVVYNGSTSMAFYGWSRTKIKNPGASFDDEGHAVTKVEDSITVSETVHLYPIFKPVYWLSFESGTSATYYPDTSYYDGEGPDSMANRIPERRGGYTFEGWFTEEDGAGVKIANADGTLNDGASAAGISVSGGRIRLSANVKLYAAWTASTTADYTIIIEKQSATDESSLPDAQKTYEFAESFLLSGTINETVTAGADYQSLYSDEAYNRLHDGANVSGASNPYHGYQYNIANSDADVTVAANGSAVLHVRYDWTDKPETEGQSFVLTFADSLETGSSDSLPVVYDGSGKVAYGASLANYVPSDPVSGRDGYSFAGWYTDRTCTTRAIFHASPLTAEEEEELAITENDVVTGYRPHVFFDTMPADDMMFYAGWKERRYIVTIDPNYGAMYAYNGSHKLEGTGATWFKSSYGEQIQEYSTVTRDYVESDSGTWYYVNHAGDGKGGSNGWPDRYTYYTQDPGEATEFGTFAQQPGAYRYDGWYEVMEDGSEEPYDFSRVIDHDTTIRLHWTKIGSFYLKYAPGEGTLNGEEELEPLYVELDDNTYADNADVVVTRTATAPEGSVFVGWKIRGDESGQVYYPGQTFTLLSNWAVKVQGKKTVYLDAVYTRVSTASIFYHANGGVIDAGSMDYGAVPNPSDPSNPIQLTGTCDEETAKVTHLVNNSQIYLSDGSGITRGNAEFAGWCANPDYDPQDESAPLLVPGEVYGVDTEGEPDLYAVWQVNVKFHLNQDSDADFGGEWGTGYELNEQGDTYTGKAFLGNSVDYPPENPVYSGSGNLTFLYWATRTGNDGSYTYTKYDFSQAVSEELDLYAFWDAPLTVPVRAADASAETIVEKTSADAGWTVPQELSVSAVAIDPLSASVTAPSGYLYAFATVSEDAAGLSEKPIQTLYYSPEDGRAHVTYADGEDAALESGDAVWFVYYQQKKLNISYMDAATDGALSSVSSLDPSAPEEAADLGGFDLASEITKPLFWADRTGYYYAFAIGEPGAGNVSGLTLITDASDTDDSRPALQIRNTWRGFEYSTDGSSWQSCGYSAQLYVVYSEAQPTVVTFRESTLGFAADLETPFTFNYRIEESDNNGNTWTQVYDSESAGASILLKNGESYSAVLFTNGNKVQRITVTQTVNQDFTTTVESSETRVYSFAAESGSAGETREVTFTNTRDSLTLEVHAAEVSVTDGSLILQDGWRSGTPSFTLATGEEKQFGPKIPGTETELVTGQQDYGFGMVFCGKDDGTTVVTVAQTAVDSIAFEPTEDGGNVYDLFLKDADGSRLGTLGESDIYYLYYPKLTVRYVLEGDEGVLELIRGSVSDTVTYGGAVLTMNGMTVEQNQKVEMPPEGLTISQNAGNGSFNMPPLLDHETNQYDLVYSKIGARAESSGSEAASNISELGTFVSEGQTLSMKLEDSRLCWSLDGNSWQTISNWPVVYAIYRERGYNLTVTKTVPVDNGYTEPYTVTVSSTAINRSSYEVEGTGSNTVEAVPASGGTLGTITFPVTDGSTVTLIGLGAGMYTVTETDNENYTLTAELGGSERHVTDNSSVTFELDGEKKLDLTNTAQYICKVGYRQFHTISAAVDWIRENSTDFSGTIEMLVDYLMPSSDAPEIPDYLSVTLTSAEGTKTITRKDTFTGGPMFLNSGSLTLQDITLDGNHVTASGSMIENEGSLTVGSGVTLTGGSVDGDGGAIYSWAGSVSVTDGTITDCSADRGGAIYARGGSVTISGGSITNNTAENGGAVCYTGGDTVTVSGGSLSGNSATADGGAVYMGSGTLSVTGGSMTLNTAAANGGAVCAANAVISVSGGTIGGEGSGNTAANGGAIYADIGSVTLAGGTVSHNSASENGGAVYVNTASFTQSGGSMTANTAVSKGGAAYTASGAVTLSNGSMTQNGAVNGAAVFVDTGSATFSGGSITANTATEGGAVGVGSTAAKLYFSGNIKITNNTMDGAPSNVYLDQDSDSVINATGLESSANIGVYVPNMNVTVGGETVDLFEYRGMPGGFFGSYTKTDNVTRFKNDRQSALSVKTETSSKRLYWGKSFTVEVRYLRSFANCFPTVSTGDLKKVDNKDRIDYFAPSGSNAASEIADDLRSNHTISNLSASASFAVAFVGDGRTFTDYVTDVRWENNEWHFYKCDGSYVTGTKLTVYFAEPAYILLENNTRRTLTVNALSVLGQSAVSNYGYVFAKNGVIQEQQYPIQASDLVLAPGGSVKLLFPGGRNAGYTLTGLFDGTPAEVSYTLTGGASSYTLSAEDSTGFTLPLSGQPNTTLNSSDSFEIIFGDHRAICKIVTDKDDSNSDHYEERTPATGSGPYEYIFSTLNQAKDFIVSNSITNPTIEMLVDYLLPGGDVLDLPQGYSYTFTTAVTGVYQYPGDDPDRRATISRDDGNNESFIRVQNGDYTDTLTVKNLIFDGKNFGGSSISGGIVRTKGYNVKIENSDFNNCVAQYGGGLFIESVWPKVGDQTPYGSLTVTNSSFTNCQSLQATDKFGGGGIWTSMREMTLTGCRFDTCEGYVPSNNNGGVQGGGVFHYVGNIGESIATKSTVTDCVFENCSASAGGSMECGAKYVTVKDCIFRNSKAKSKNGGALNVWVYDYNNTSAKKECWVNLDNCIFENCYCLKTDNGNGGAMRSTAIHNTITNCTFINNKGKLGGAINITNSNSTDTTISGCAFNDCTAYGQGGAVYCVSKNLTINGSSDSQTAIRNCSATNEGGGVYHGGSVKLEIEDSVIAQNTAGTTGGGVYSSAAAMTVNASEISGNTASGSGGGIYKNNKNGLLSLENGATVTGNVSGAMGGGVYTAGNLALQGVTVTGNTLTHDTAGDAAGIYLPDHYTLTVGKTKPEGWTEEWFDTVIVQGNTTANGTLSDLRLPMSGSENSNSVKVLCDLQGEVRVVNAAVKGTQFGSTGIAYVGGFSDLEHVFIADDDSLYGTIDRTDIYHKKIIWGTEPVCKITDERGRLLYMNIDGKSFPAVFDYLDRNNGSGTNEISAFGILRGHNPDGGTAKLYNADGTPYTGTTYQVKMLVENYTEDSAICTPNSAEKTVILTTAGSNDNLYKYRGRTGTRATVRRGSHANAMVTVKCNLTVQNIILDSDSESGASAGKDSRILVDETDGTTIRLGKNATLQNAKLTGDSYGAGVRLYNGAAMIIEGGTIRNCSTEKGGGGVQIKQGSLTITGGNITRCSAGTDGGGVYFEEGSFTMTGGSITRCSAANGAGVYVKDGQSMTMTGGSISSNTASAKGGGIAVAGGNARLYFSGAAYVYGNTLNGKACNVQMDQHFEYGAMTESHASDTTVIVSRGLIRGAAIGVYVPDGTDLYSKHGDIRLPFGTYVPGSSTDTLNYFINDRNALKGGLYEEQADDNYMIYWVKIYSLQVSKLVLSDNPADAQKDFSFTVELSDEAAGIDAREFSGTYGDMTFTNGVASFTLKSGESITAEKLPCGYSYKVTENLSSEEQGYYRVTPGIVQEGSMNVETRYLYEVDFNNLHAICKITDATEGLLYYKDNSGNLRPAVYSQLQNAFNALSAYSFYTANGDPVSVNTDKTRVEMLVDHALESPTSFQSGTRALLTTADPDALDGFPYVGDGSTATITRAYNGASMITVNGDLTLGNITLDGGSGSEKTANTNGGILNVPAGGRLTVGTGSTIQNSVTSAHGGGVWLAQGAVMNISGAPAFVNNTSSGDTIPSGATNGDIAYFTAKQDIFIDGYQNTDAASLVVTGNLTGSLGSIWVWADDDPHYKQSKQFALLQGGNHSGLNVFRNARTDTDTENPKNSDPLYLYGVTRGDGKVYWSGGANLTVTKTVTGEMGDTSSANTFLFTLTVSGAPANTQYRYTIGTTSGTITLNASGQGTFRLAHGQRITIEALPLNTDITVTEDHGFYFVTVPDQTPDHMTSYTVNAESGRTNGAAFRLTADAELLVTNCLPAVAPTGTEFSAAPFLIMLGAALLLAPVTFRRKRRGRED